MEDQDLEGKVYNIYREQDLDWSGKQRGKPKASEVGVLKVDKGYEIVEVVWRDEYDKPDVVFNPPGRFKTLEAARRGARLVAER